MVQLKRKVIIALDTESDIYFETILLAKTTLIINGGSRI